jgi:parallel beta-helix repeat protein
MVWLIGWGLIIGSISISPIAAPAPAVYYVNASTGDDGNTGASPATAWRTISKANGAVQPGDTVLIYGGIYNETIRPARSGAAQMRITYRAVPGEAVIVEGAKLLVDLHEKSYISIEGITFRDPISGWGEIQNGHHNELIGNVFIGNGQRPDTAFSGLYLFDGSSSNRIANNAFRNWGAARIDLPWGDALRLTNAPYNLIEGNTLTNAGHALLGIDASYNVIRNNSFENAWSIDVEIAWWKSPPWATGQEFPAQGNVFESNVVAGAARALDGHNGGPGVELAAAGTIFRGNVIVQNETSGVLLNGWEYAPNVYGNRVYHNTIVANGAPGVMATNWGITRVDISNNELKNNVLSQNDLRGSGVQVLFRFWPEATYDAEYFQGSYMIAGNCISKAPTLDIRSLDGEQLFAFYQEHYPKFVEANRDAKPQFVNPATGDYRLNRCRCVDAGVALTTTTRAGSGNMVPVLDASYFTDGYGLVSGDQVKVGANPAILVLGVDYANKTLTLERAISWKRGDPVYWGDFVGHGPDAGAFEFAGSTP